MSVTISLFPFQYSLIINILWIQQLIHPLPEFALLGRLRYLDHIPLIGIDDRCVQIMADPRLVTTIVHMYMTMEKISRLIMLHDPAEAPEALVRQILGIAKILCRCMWPPECPVRRGCGPSISAGPPLTHLTLGVLILSHRIAHRTSKSCDPKSLIHKHGIVNTDAAIGRLSVVMHIMIAVYIKNRNRRKCQPKTTDTPLSDPHRK